MPKEIVTFSELDKIVAQYKKDKATQGALLVLKGQCKPYREKGIPKRVATAIVTAARTQEQHLVQLFETDDNEEMFFFHDEKHKALGNVIQIVFEDE